MWSNLDENQKYQSQVHYCVENSRLYLRVLDQCMSDSHDLFNMFVFNQTSKIVQRTKILHNLITHWNIEVTHECKVIIDSDIFATNKIQVV